MSDKDENFVPVTITKGEVKASAFLYKPQNIVVTRYITADAIEHWGWKIKEEEDKEVTKTVCDICGKEMPTTKHEDRIENLNFCISSHGNIWDICTECREDLNRWMTKRKEERVNIVEGVTCKNCKYYRADEDGSGYCTNHSKEDMYFWCHDDFYCADGERKE